MEFDRTAIALVGLRALGEPFESRGGGWVLCHVCCDNKQGAREGPMSCVST